MFTYINKAKYLSLFLIKRFLKLKLSSSPPFFIINAWSTLLLSYPNQSLCLHLAILLWFGYLIGYQEPDIFIDSNNLLSTLI